MANVFDPRPDSVELNGITYQLTLSYDRVLIAFDTLDDTMLSDDQKFKLICELLSTKVPRTFSAQIELVKAIFALFPKSDGGEKTIDFHQDAALIRSAFFRTYGIDLTVQKIHWFLFAELLADLPRDTALMRVIDIRSRPLPKPTKYNRDEIAELQKAKAKVAIKISDEKRAETFANSIKNAFRPGGG